MLLSLLTLILFLSLTDIYSQTFNTSTLSIINDPILSTIEISATALPIITKINSNGNGYVPLSASISQSVIISYPLPDLINNNGPVPIIMAVSMNSLSSIDGVNQQFQGDFYLQTFWPDNTLCNNITTDTCVFDPNNNWNPSLEFINLVGDLVTYIKAPYDVISTPSVVSNIRDSSGNTIDFSVWGNVWVSSNQRYSATFSNIFNLIDFPYDFQNFAVKIESALFDDSQIKFYYPYNQVELLVPPELSVTEWDLRKPSAETPILTHEYTLFGNYSRAVFAVRAQRQVYYYINKYVLCIIFMVLMDLMIFALVTDNSDRMGGTITIFLAFIMFLFAASQSLPHIAYLTRLDKFLGTSLIFVFSSLCAHAFIYVMHEISEWGTELANEIKMSATKPTNNDEEAPSNASNKIFPTGFNAPQVMQERLSKFGLVKEVLRSRNLLEMFYSLNYFRKLDIVFTIISFVVYFTTLAGILLIPATEASSNY